jgi:hypothetical protein
MNEWSHKIYILFFFVFATSELIRSINFGFCGVVYLDLVVRSFLFYFTCHFSFLFNVQCDGQKDHWVRFIVKKPSELYC